MPTKPVPKFHVSVADMHCENAEWIPTENLMEKESADLLNSKSVNLFFRVGFVQQGYLQLTLTHEQADAVLGELARRLNVFTNPTETPGHPEPTGPKLNRYPAESICFCSDPGKVDPDCPIHGAIAGLSSKPPSRTVLKDALNPEGKEGE